MRSLPLIFVFLSLGLVAWTVMNGVRDPMDTRRERLETRLMEVAPAPDSYADSTNPEAAPSYENIYENTALWRELIVAPAPAPVRVMPPNLRKKLEGIVPTRSSIGSVGSLKVLIKSTDNPRGTFMGVGEKVRGVTILKIEKRSVLFGLSHQGKSYKYTIARR